MTAPASEARDHSGQFDKELILAKCLEHTHACVSALNSPPTPCYCYLIAQMGRLLGVPVALLPELNAGSGRQTYVCASRETGVSARKWGTIVWGGKGPEF